MPLVRPAGVVLKEATDPRVYIAPLQSRVDAQILSASLVAAGFAPPRWVPSRWSRADEATLRAAFLAGEPFLVPLAAPRRGPDRLARLLSWAKSAGRKVDLVPIEVLWSTGGATSSLRALLFGDPYDPPGWVRWIRLHATRQVRVLLGPPGTLEEIEAEAPRRDDALAVSGFVRGQALKALSQTERQVLGERYKVPRFVAEEILRVPEFRDRLAAAGAEAGLTRKESLQRGERALRELASGHEPFYVELLRRFAGWLYSQVYDAEIAVDPRALERLRELGKTSSLVFIPSHKSNFDHLVLYYLLVTAGFSPPHTAAGINMAFFPMGWILPRTGAYFIRRSFRDDPVYRAALAEFMSYLVRGRFHQEFFIEGGRTRSGKLLPPRYGMLRYIVDGSRRSGVDDVRFVPTAITYDQLLEVEEYVRQVLGDEKERESFGFLIRTIRAARKRRLGRVYVSFAEPIPLRAHLERAGDDQLVVEKLAFQIANQINAVTRLTPVSVVCSVHLGAGLRALTWHELEERTRRILEFAGERGSRLDMELGQGAKATLQAGLDALCVSGVVEVYDRGAEPVYFVTERGRHVASYYRNTILHFFLSRAIAGLSRSAAGSEDSVADWALRIRDLLKFEFFFRDREAFLSEIEREVRDLSRGEEVGAEPLEAAGPRILLDYLESYWVVSEALRTLSLSRSDIPKSELLVHCHAIGRQLLLQERVSAPELLSNVTFENAIKLLTNRGAAETAGSELRLGAPRVLQELQADLGRLAALARR